MCDTDHLWGSVDSVYKSLHKCFVPRINALSKWMNTIIPHKSVAFSLSGVSVQERKVGIEDIQDLLAKPGNDLAAISKAGIKPLLFIDEANHIYRYLDRKELGQVIIGKVMDFIVQNTKQARRFSVVLASSSSMFIRRILDHTVNYVSVFVGGDLTSEEAKVYWEQYLPQRFPTHHKVEVSFPEVYVVVGGHMFHLVFSKSETAT